LSSLRFSQPSQNLEQHSETNVQEIALFYQLEIFSSCVICLETELTAFCSITINCHSDLQGTKPLKWLSKNDKREVQETWRTSWNMFVLHFWMHIMDSAKEFSCQTL
jgi:hypothetical protein